MIITFSNFFFPTSESPSVDNMSRRLYPFKARILRSTQEPPRGDINPEVNEVFIHQYMQTHILSLKELISDQRQGAIQSCPLSGRLTKSSLYSEA